METIALDECGLDYRKIRSYIASNDSILTSNF